MISNSFFIFAIVILSSCQIQSYPNSYFTDRRINQHRIVGGQNTTIDKHPHMLSLQYFSNHMCGASVLSEYWAMTAGHCFGATDPLMDFLTVRASTSFHNQGGVHYLIKTIIRHENYSGFDNDIALLELKDPFVFGDTLKPIKIPQHEENLEPGTVAVAIGWGRTETNDYLSEQLQEVFLYTISQEICLEVYEDRFNNGMMCAFYPLEGKDSCTNDSGGPLVVGDTQFGIVSWGPNPCGNPKFPGVYTKVSTYTNWIQKHTGVLNY